MTIRVVIADDQPVVRDGLAMLSASSTTSRSWPPPRTGSRRSTHPRRAARRRADGPANATAGGCPGDAPILDSLPETRVLILTTYADDEFLFPALQAGARGYSPRTRAQRRSNRRSERWPPATPTSTRPCTTADHRRPRSHSADTDRRTAPRRRGSPPTSSPPAVRSTEADRRRTIEHRDRRRARP